MANFYKDIRLTNIPANKVLTVDNNGIIQAATTNVTDIASDALVQNINNSLNMTSANVTNLQSDVGGLHGDVSGINNSIVMINGNVSNINNSMVNVTADISNLANRVSALEDATNDISARLTNINGE